MGWLSLTVPNNMLIFIYCYYTPTYLSYSNIFVTAKLTDNNTAGTMEAHMMPDTNSEHNQCNTWLNRGNFFFFYIYIIFHCKICMMSQIYIFFKFPWNHIFNIILQYFTVKLYVFSFSKQNDIYQMVVTLTDFYFFFFFFKVLEH